jgi:hypothetical protein
MTKALLVMGGILNTIFFLFHVLLGCQIHRLTDVSLKYRGLMEALNVTGVLFLFFFAYVSFFCGAELLGTRLGRTVLALVSALYLSRALEEFILFNSNLTIFVACALLGAVYVVLLSCALRGGSALPVAKPTGQG